jgi:hypothetical protein
MQQPGPSAGRLPAGPVCLAPDGVWLAAVSPRRWWALTPPFHPYLRRLRREARRWAVSFLCHFPSAFAAWVAPASCPSVSGLSSSREARGHPACESNCNRVCSNLLFARRLELHCGHVIMPAACMTNSPQTRHSRLAPRSSAWSSCSSVRWSGATELTAAGTPPSRVRECERAPSRSARARRSRAEGARVRSLGRTV